MLDKIKPKPRIKTMGHHDRYCNVHPYVETAIHLGGSDGSNSVSVNDNTYINANRIRSIFNEPVEDNLIIAA